MISILYELLSMMFGKRCKRYQCNLQNESHRYDGRTILLFNPFIHSFIWMCVVVYNSDREYHFSIWIFNKQNVNKNARNSRQYQCIGGSLTYEQQTGRWRANEYVMRTRNKDIINMRRISSFSPHVQWICYLLFLFFLFFFLRVSCSIKQVLILLYLQVDLIDFMGPTCSLSVYKY